MPTYDDLSGMIFGRWKVLCKSNDKNFKGSYWLCRCLCGNERIVQASRLKAGRSKSCGCLQKELTRQRSIKHGMNGTRLYQCWQGMLVRCYNTNSKAYKNYGGRGISVCDEWKQFDSFYKWSMNNGYKSDLTIDRIDNNGNYAPSNCKWSTYLEQQNNRRDCKYYKFNGKQMTLSQWARHFGINRGLLYIRVGEKGWTIEQFVEWYKRELYASFL
jgi:hypothetical protein